MLSRSSTAGGGGVVVGGGGAQRRRAAGCWNEKISRSNSSGWVLTASPLSPVKLSALE
jgi:hypothetical protein